MLSWSLVAYGLILVILTIPCQKIESVVTDDAVLLYNKAVKYQLLFLDYAFPTKLSDNIPGGNT